MNAAAATLLILALIASTPGDAQAQVRADDLEDVERRLKDREAEERRLRKEAAARAKEVTALRRQLVEAAQSIQEAERKITSLEATIADLSAEKTEAESALRRESAAVSEILAGLQSLELSKPPALFVSPGDANKAARAAMLLSDAAPAVEARAAALREAVARLEELAEAIEKERAAYAATNRELGARRDVLAGLMRRKERERDVAESLAAAAQKETARLAVEATSLREIVRRLERLAHSVTPRLKPARPRAPAGPALIEAAPSPPSIKTVAPRAYAPQRSFADSRGAIRPPVAGRLTGEFGAPRPEGGSFEGLRFRARDSAIVTAPFEGKVVVARDWRPIGNLVILDVGGGYHILLLGVGRILVEENQSIAAGEPVAQMAEGDAELDLEIRKNGEPVNPALWLSRNSKGELAL